MSLRDALGQADLSSRDTLMTTLSAADHAQVIREATSQFWAHITPIVWIAFAIHIALFGLFLALESVLMCVINALSILAYIVCLVAIRARSYLCAGMLISLEIITHAAVATWKLGWDSNFHFYLFCVVPIIAFSFQARLGRRLLLSLAVVVVAVAGFSMRRQMGLDSGLSERMIDVLGIINSLSATSLLLHAAALSVRFTLSMQLSLFHTANRDSLTNLYTRRRVLQRLRQMDAKPPVASNAVILLDIDHFKSINDQYGHEVGDVVLQRVADIVGDCVRSTDIAARWGGEEFLVLMPDTTSTQAQDVAQRIMTCIREQAGSIADAKLQVTATVAVATMLANEVFKETLNRADQMLYLGKQEGRDRMMLAE